MNENKLEDSKGFAALLRLVRPKQWITFAMTIDGYGPYQIASKLKSEKVLIPSAYLAQHGEGVNKNKTFKDVYGWGSSTICNILEKREYLGHTINFKTRKPVSYTHLP